ncbi:MAG: DUF1631 domain-containing protein [Hydrogenophaga sp.]|jgi:hypothetical protein|nr:DUF1631 domain-containing protein [Hydrogenophaga sp.]
MNARAESPFDACLKEALDLSAEWVPRWLGHLHDVLQQRETAAANLHEKQTYGQARIALAGHRDIVAERFLAALAAALQSMPPPAGVFAEARPAGARSLSSLSFDDLELMDHQQVQETVELARVLQVVKMAADEELVAFNARLSRAQGLDVVRHQTNPLRPDVVVAALMKALTGLHVDEAIRARWLHAGAVSLGSELQKLYRLLTDQLDRWGVQPAGYAVVQTAAGRPASAVPRTESVPAASLIGSDALLTLDHLHQLLVGNLEQGGSKVSDQGASGSGNAMVRTLAAEVVTLMLRRIADDTRLVPPVRELLQGLKPALLQLARTDPRFFADRQNPARRLLDLLTARALAFTSEQDAGFPAFAQQLKDTVQALQRPTHSLPDLLHDLLQRLNRSEVAGAQAPARGLAMQTLVRVEQRNLLAERVAMEIKARNDFERAPGVVRRFLAGPWAQVVAQARMDAASTDGTSPADAPALRFMDLLPDLLWSSQLALASRNRPRLIKVIPSLLRTLREGLDAIDYPRPQAESFFQALMGLHEAAYKTQRNDSAESDHPASRQMPLESETWMHPAEARDSGFMEDLLIETQPAFLDTEPMPGDWQSLQAENPVPVQPLAVGSWVDLREGEQDLRCQLTWASPHGTMFLFNAANGRSISLTRRGLERLQALGRLRVVAQNSLVDEALDAVTREALRNSGQAPDQG